MAGTKTDKGNALEDIANAEKDSASLPVANTSDEEESAPESFWTEAGRKLREAFKIAFLTTIHKGTELYSHWVHGDKEWMNKMLITASGFTAVIGFCVIIGYELAADCVHAHRRFRSRIGE